MSRPCTLYKASRHVEMELSSTGCVRNLPSLIQKPTEDLLILPFRRGNTYHKYAQITVDRPDRYVTGSIMSHP
ncbi:uncharacterized protein BT62DRAFT_933100 [Guyanagaster necrorhizus]|uniref:Uncharacterized protein n=1 Tax=Guyanagaster necrorhizus TaxID=856835 RepID=A0A9P7VSL7_9AGAR|nr:uncharacterized protein BT62DRAFT_933100 [Guyanagaster necrorhizus MCA 3950]KAG7445274.1 hypothetical protein BT62DRAFT_933100 [Guyanagaster necrorhizus MCA 3950]